MPQPGQAVILRLHRNVAGMLFPWDCIYFFKRADEALLPQIFPCSLVIDTSSSFIRKLKHAFTSPYGDRGLDNAFPMHRWEEEEAAARVRRKPPMDDVFMDPRRYVALIPTLHLRGRYGKKGQSGPVYLAARLRTRAMKRHKGKFLSPTPDERLANLQHMMSNLVTAKSYFLHRGEKIQPVCLCCRNSLEFLDGRCTFGTPECYKNLLQANASDFAAGLHLYKTLYHAPDSELYDTEITNEQLHRNEG